MTSTDAADSDTGDQAEAPDTEQPKPVAKPKAGTDAGRNT